MDKAIQEKSMRAVFIILIGSVFLAACGGGHSPSNEVGQFSPSSQSSSSLSSDLSSESSLNSQGSSNIVSNQSSSSLSSSQASSSSESSSQSSVNYFNLISPPHNEKPLALANEADFIKYIKNGIRLQLERSYNESFYPQLLDSTPRTPPPPFPELVSIESRLSQRNEHRAGIDEGDYAKYDGAHWFVSQVPEYGRDSDGRLPRIQILKTNANVPTLEVIGEISLDEEQGDLTELYLLQQQAGTTTHLAAIQNLWGDVDLALPSSPFFMGYSFWYWPGPKNTQISVQLIDVKDPKAPATDWNIKIDGSLIESKKINNILYLVTRYDSWLDGLANVYENQLASVRDSNENILTEATVEDLLPSFQIGSNKQLLTTQCFVQEGIQNNNGFNRLVYVTAIDLLNKKLISSQCLNSGVETLHISTSALYLTGTIFNNTPAGTGEEWERPSGYNYYDTFEGDKTVVHKFTLNESGTEYSATGIVPGYLWGGSNAESHLHEYEGTLRIITSSWGDNTQHQLSLLEESNGELLTIAQLPNLARPDSIGKTGEKVHSVRFDANYAFITSPKKTDPIYVVNLSNKLDPKNLGSIAALGFEAYLHPINENYMLTFGRENTFGKNKGIKIEIVNVGKDELKVVDSLVLGSQKSFSEILNNLHALSILRVNENQLRISIPIERYDQVGQFLPIKELWKYSGLQLLEVNGLSGNNASLANAGVVTAEEKSSFKGEPIYRQGSSRSVLHDDAVFFFYNNNFWAADWSLPEQASGPLSSGGN